MNDVELFAKLREAREMLNGAPGWGAHGNRQPNGIIALIDEVSDEIENRLSKAHGGARAEGN